MAEKEKPDKNTSKQEEETKKELKDTETEKTELEVVKEKENEIKEEIKEENKRAEDYLNNWKRCQADFENYRKSQEKMFEEFKKFASLDVILQFLPVLDNFNASLDHVPEKEKNSPWVKGIIYIKKQLEDVLKSNEVMEIETREGDEFDPLLHEAVAEAENKKFLESTENDSTKRKFSVKKVLQKGYKMNNRVIRAVKVIVTQ